MCLTLPEVKLRSRLAVKQGLYCLIEESFSVPCDDELRKTHDAIGSDVRTKRFGNNAMVSPEFLLGCLNKKMLHSKLQIENVIFATKQI